MRTFGVVILLAAASVQGLKIDEQMTDEEIANFFHTTRDKIPEYEVVLVKHNRYKRLDPNLRLQFTAFGKEIDTYLHPSDGQLMGANTPVWLAFTKPDGRVAYKKMREGIVGIVVSTFFTNPTDFSTVAVIQAKDENPSFHGIVGTVIIRPLPDRFREEARSRRNSEGPNANRTTLNTHYHVIIKSTSVTEAEKIRRLERQIREASRSGNGTDASRIKVSDPEIIYPSLLIQTDFKGSKTTQDDLDYKEEIIYQIAFWNAVDLRFRHVNDPKIRLRVAGLIIGQDRNATPYLHNHRSGDVLNMDRAWFETEEYWYEMTRRKDFPQYAYDIVVTMTDTNMLHAGRPVVGLGRRAFCLKSFLSAPWNAVAIVRDNGGFNGILTSAHELGHIFGLDHDEDSGDECDKSNGFIMAPTLVARPKNLEWSPCSLKSISHFLRNNDIHCYDEAAEFYPPGQLIPRLLPGDVWGPHKQCQARGYAWACDPSPDMCTEMPCYYNTYGQALLYGWWCQNSGPAAEGTICAPGRKCVDGVCQCMTEDCIFINGTAES